MSSSALEKLTKKKGKQLSKILGINSGPSTQVIADMQARINNPLFKLSIADYEAMCGNKMMVKMMSKVIGCDVKQLTKFCKYIIVFAENIESSPKSIKKKIKETISINASKRRGSLHVLPEDILEKIVNKYKTIFKIKYVLKDWIPLEKLNWTYLSINPNAIELLKENPDEIYWDWLSGNPNAMELLKENPTKIDWDYLSSNPNAIDILKANPDKIDWGYLSKNSNAIDLIKDKINEDDYEKINWYFLSENPNAIELLKAYPEEIDWGMLSGNPNAIELLKAYRDNINWEYLSKNPNAINMLKANPTKINWRYLSLNKNKEAIELLKANPENIDWNWLSENPNAMELLKANPKKINWGEVIIKPEHIRRNISIILILKVYLNNLFFLRVLIE